MDRIFYYCYNELLFDWKIVWGTWTRLKHIPATILQLEKPFLPLLVAIILPLTTQQFIFSQFRKPFDSKTRV